MQQKKSIYLKSILVAFKNLPIAIFKRKINSRYFWDKLNLALPENAQKGVLNAIRLKYRMQNNWFGYFEI
jgi:hypothetical protein